LSTVNCTITIIFAIVFAIIKRKAFGLTFLDALKGAAFVVFGCVFGAKALYCIGQIMMRGSESSFWTSTNWNTMVRAGGVLYGSVLGAIGMLFLFAKLFDYKFIDIIGIVAISLFGANFFSRLGCLFAGCCYGIRLSNGSLFPYQLTEGVLCALVFIGFVIWRPERKHKNIILPLSVVLYGVIRFVLEFFRGDANRGLWFSLSTSQWISIFMIIAAVGLFWRLRVCKNRWRDGRKEAENQ
jgi:phosphatidylglycerol:prolipoprotein diacylglycerol transferase